MGAVQGLTEFLPVSSSGHLVMLEHILHVQPDVRLPLTTMLHLGTAVAMVAYFMPRIARVVGGCVSGKASTRNAAWRMVWFVLLASTPAAVTGLLLEGPIERAFAGPGLAAGLLLVTGVALFGTRFVTREGSRLTWWRAVLVGLGQALAILPGISRSGATIATGIYCGVERREAFEFSFLLAIPAILGAAALELRKVDPSAVGPTGLVAGVLAALLTGLGALWLLRRAVSGRRLYVFAFYCWAAGLAALATVR
jgi:undecaprenyl-diphosphatase